MSLTLTRRHNVDRFGYLIPTKYGNVPMVGVVATYRPGEGRFGGAVAVEEGTTNLVPSNRLKFEGWIAYQGAEVTVTQGCGIPGVTPDGATRIQTVGGTSRIKYYIHVGPDPGNPVSLSVWVYNIGQKTVQVIGNAIPETIDLAPGEIRLCTLSTSSMSSSNRQLHFRALDVNDSLDFIAYQPQIEVKPFATSFVDGTRAEGRLVYPTSVFNPAQGTISMWVRKHQLIDYNARVFWSETGSYRFGVHDSRSGGLTWAYITSGANQASGGYLAPGTWHHLVMTWHRDEGWMRGYLDGEPVASLTFDPGTDPGFVYSNTWGLGARVDRGLAFNGLFDELLILPYAASEEEIRAWYEADGPIPPHPDALLQWDWQAVRPATMVAL